jgi:hypothetical protein
MPDTPVEATSHGPYDPGIEVRVTRLEDDVREMRGTLTQLVPVLTRIDATLSSTLPHLATKAELADLRLELTSALSATRSETASEFSAVRSEMASAFSTTRSEAANTRSELVEMIAELRSEASDTKAALIGIIAELRSETATPDRSWLG